jgi:hypothetical protein
LEKYIVIFSNGDPQALGKLRDIRTELLTNTLLVSDYRIRFLRKQVAEGSFEAFAGEHSCKFEAYGTGSQVRGIRHGAHRPTKIIFDDVEHSSEVENEAIRSKYATWYREDITKLGDENTSIEGVGTILHKKALLVELIDNPMYDSRVYKSVISWSEREDLWEKWRGLLTDLEYDKPERLARANRYYEENKEAMLQGTQVLWPEKNPYVELMKELVEDGRRAFMKERQNTPLGSDEKLFERLHWYHETEHEGKRGFVIESSGLFIPMNIMQAYGVLDPATGQTKSKPGKKGDFACLLTGLHDPRGRLFAHSDWTKRAPPSKQIEQMFVQHDEWQYEKFGVETNLYRNLLLPNIVAARKAIEQERKKLIKLPLYDIEAIENKHKRIYTLEPKITNGYILFNRNLSQEFMGQLDDFPNAEHDDGPDALEMLYGLVNNRYKTSAVDASVMGTS